MNATAGILATDIKNNHDEQVLKVTTPQESVSIGQNIKQTDLSTKITESHKTFIQFGSKCNLAAKRDMQ